MGNINNIKFTLSVSPSLSRNSLEIINSNEIIAKLKVIGANIYDINFTCHIPPFTEDAHGVYITESENKIHLRQVLALQEKTGITVSPVFNNIYTPNTLDNLELFISNFRELYELGIRSISMPHIFWLKQGLIQREFPDLQIKNTVLRSINSGQDFWNHAEAGYNYLNLNRVITRDVNSLKEIHQAQKKFKDLTGKHVYTSILTGEGCLGNCPLWYEHYQHTLMHPDINRNISKNLTIFRYPQSFACLSDTDSDYQPLYSVGLPYFREDFLDICDYFDIIKLPGRRAFQSLSDNINAILSFFENDSTFLYDPPEIIQSLYKNHNKLLKKWRKTVKTCRFQCWDCNLCSELISKYISSN